MVLADLARGWLRQREDAARHRRPMAPTDVVAECERMVREALALHGGLDVLVSAAGVWVEGNDVGDDRGRSGTARST